MNDVRFNVKKGGLDRQAPGEDHISALSFSIATPAGFAGAKIKEVRSVTQTEDLGITEVGAFAEMYYQVSEFYRISPGATLYIAFGLDTSDALAFVNAIIAASDGKVRQLGIGVPDLTTVTSELQAIVTASENLHAPFTIIPAYDGVAALDLGAAASMADETASGVAGVLVAGDGSAKGAALATTLGKVYVPALGATLGAASSASVHLSIAYVRAFNLSDNSELDVIRLADGTDYPTEAELDAVNDKRFLTLRKHIGVAGTYLADSHTAIVATDDFAAVEIIRTFQKVRRVVRTKYLPELNGPLKVDPDTGKLAQGTIKYFESLGLDALTPMLSAGELSGFDVYVDPDQNVLSTSKLIVKIRLVPVGVGREIEIEMGYTVKVGS